MTPQGPYRISNWGQTPVHVSVYIGILVTMPSYLLYETGSLAWLLGLISGLIVLNNTLDESASMNSERRELLFDFPCPNSHSYCEHDI